MGARNRIDPAWAVNWRAQDERWSLRCDSMLNFDRPELNTIRDIWRARASEQSVPARGDLDARTLKPFLRHISIVERVPDGARRWRYRKRLSATATTEIVGETMGRFLDEFALPGVLSQWICVLDVVLCAKVPLRTFGPSLDPALPHLSLECFVAPLKDAQGEATLVLVCTYVESRLRSDTL